MSPRAHPARDCFWVLKSLTIPLAPPNRTRRTLVHLCKYRIETAQAAKTCQRRNLGHRPFGIIQKSLRPLHARRPGDLTGTGTEMLVEQSGEVSGSNAKTSRKRFNRRPIERASRDQPHRAIDRRP